MRFKDPIQREIYYRGQIDYCYWYINRIEFDSNFDPLSICKLKIEAIRDVIRIKKRCGFDYSEDTDSLAVFITEREKIKSKQKERR